MTGVSEGTPSQMTPTPSLPLAGQEVAQSCTMDIRVQALPDCTPLDLRICLEDDSCRPKLGDGLEGNKGAVSDFAT
jgi:hypothetical protein